MERTIEKIGWNALWRIDKFRDPEGEVARCLQAGLSMQAALERFAGAFIATERIEANLALNEGLQELIDLAFGLGTPTAFDTTNGYLGVGDSNSAAAAAQTGLQAATNKLYKVFDDTYPVRTNQTVEARATFGSAEGNFAWEEYTLANGNSDAAKNLNRKVESKGTKASGETWTLSLQITFS
ncbi:MAG: hypothetical protein ACFCUE_04310 [Candidatus Bathyarchaeia archaeon]|jgi:hypothetical protein